LSLLSDHQTASLWFVTGLGFCFQSGFELFFFSNTDANQPLHTGYPSTFTDDGDGSTWIVALASIVVVLRMLSG
jgi:hypothetical protein